MQKTRIQKLLEDLNKVRFFRNDDRYYFEDEIPDSVHKVLTRLDLRPERLGLFSGYVNSRYEMSDELRESMRNKVRLIPEGLSKHSTPKSGSRSAKSTVPASTSKVVEVESPAEESSAEQAVAAAHPEEGKATNPTGKPHPAEPSSEPNPSKKRQRGRPKGSKNKKTLQREAEERERRSEAGLPEDEPPKPKKGRGRPKGSRNRKTLERERMQQENSDFPASVT